MHVSINACRHFPLTFLVGISYSKARIWVWGVRPTGGRRRERAPSSCFRVGNGSGCERRRWRSPSPVRPGRRARPCTGRGWQDDAVPRHRQARDRQPRTQPPRTPLLCRLVYLSTCSLSDTMLQAPLRARSATTDDEIARPASFKPGQGVVSMTGRHLDMMPGFHRWRQIDYPTWVRVVL